MLSNEELLDKIDKLLEESEDFWAIDLTDDLGLALALAYADGLEAAATQIASLKGISIGVSFKVVDTIVLDFIKDHAAEMVRNINEGTKYYLRSMIYGGVREAIPIDNLVDAILENLFEDSDFSEGRIRSICNYEIAQAQTFGWIRQCEEVGIEQKQWSTIGEDACEICLANEAMGPQPLGSKPYDNVFGEKCEGPPAHPRH